MAGLRRPAPAVGRAGTATAPIRIPHSDLPATSVSQLKSLSRKHGLTTKKSLGQHFVADPEVISEIVQLAHISPQDHVLEVGPGLGSLTGALAAAGAQITAVETDRSLEPALAETLGTYLTNGQVNLVWQDATTANWQELLAHAPQWKLVANLPYNIATGLILDLLRDVPAICEMVVMVQLEVAERLTTQAGHASYGIPSVKLAYWAHASLLLTLEPEIFFPPPKVASAVIRVTRHGHQQPVGHQALFGLVERAFRQRRKMLRNSLASVVPSEVFDQAGIAPTDRPETLDLAAWLRLAHGCQHAQTQPAADSA